MTPDEKIAKYIALRDRQAAMKKRFSAIMAPLTEEMLAIENDFLGSLQKAGLQNMKGASGTASLIRRTSVKAADWDEFFDFVLKDELYHMLERRPSKTAVTEYIEEVGNTPPGINIDVTVGVTFRKS